MTLNSNNILVCLKQTEKNVSKIIHLLNTKKTIDPRGITAKFANISADAIDSHLQTIIH